MENNNIPRKKYNALTIANQFLSIAEREVINLNTMKLQKLIYLAHGWSLSITDKALIRESIMAWRFGPVIPCVYSTFKVFGMGNITKFAKIDREVFDKKANAIVERVWEIYG